MSRVLFSALIFLLGQCPIAKLNTAEPTSSIASRHAAIESAYQENARDPSWQKKNPAERRAVRSLKAIAIRELVRSVDGVDLATLSAADLTAIALAKEELHEHEASVAFARRALKMGDPQKPTYAVIIRSLLMLNRLDEAEATIREANSALSPGNTIWDMHFSLFLKESSVENWDSAFRYFSLILDFWEMRLFSDMRSATILKVRLSQFQRVCNSAGRQKEMRECLGKLRESCRSALSTWMLRDAESATETTERVLAISCLFQLESEISSILNDEQVELALRNWLEWLRSDKQLQQSGSIRSIVTAFFVSARSSSHFWRNWDPLEAALPAGEVARSDDIPSTSEMGLIEVSKVFGTMVHLEKQARLLIGQHIDIDWEKFEWISNTPAASKEDLQKILVLYVVESDSPRVLLPAITLSRWKNQFDKDRVEFICISPVSAIAEEGSRDDQLPIREGVPTTEVRNLAKHQSVKVRWGLTSIDSAPFEGRTSQTAPRFIIVDRSGVVQSVILGIDDVKTRFTESEIARVLAGNAPGPTLREEAECAVTGDLPQ